MYHESDYETIKAQIKRRSLLMLSVCFLLLIPAVIGIIAHFNRNESLTWMTYLFLLMMGVFILFADGLFVSPLRAYKRHLNNVLHGLTATLHGRFKTLDKTVCIRDNVAFYPLIINVGDMHNEEDDRLFYFDILKPFPPLSEGEAVVVISHDKGVADINP